MDKPKVISLQEFVKAREIRPLADCGNLYNRADNVITALQCPLNEPVIEQGKRTSAQKRTLDSNKKPTQGRKRPKRVGSRQLEQCSAEKILMDISHPCCKRNCLQDLTFEFISETRTEFWKLVICDQNSLVCNHRATVLPEERCVLSGCLVCSECWRVVHGISKSRYYELKGKTSPAKDSRDGQKYDKPRTADAVNFIRDSAVSHGEVQPNSGLIMLPTCYSIQNMYQDYVQSHDNPYCLKHFRRLVIERFPEVKASERSSFTECKECSMIRKAKSANLSKRERLLIEEQKRAHLLVQRIAREKYYKHIKKAKDNPQKYCSIIVDNMDQAKTNLPRLPSYHKGDVNLTRIHHHVTGILSHGQGKAFIFTWTDKFPSDTNITMNCLLKVFEDLSMQGQLPPVLYLQADNSAKDNKNFILLGFLGSLVQRKIFQKVKLSFLMVGHTHEDVDQLFSRVSIQIGNKAIKTLDHLHAEIQQSYHPEPMTTFLENIWDYRGLALESPVQLSGHKSPHIFKFKLVEEEVKLFYKEWPMERSAYKCVDITNLAGAFRNEPLPIGTMPEKGRKAFTSMEADLPKWEKSGSMSPEEKNWWTGHLHGQFQYGQPDITTMTAFREHLRLIPTEEMVPPAVAEAINRHMTSLTQESTIRTVRQRRRP